MHPKLIKSVNVLIGIFISSIGTAILYLIGWGSAPISTLTEGFSNFFNVTYGLSNIIINSLFLIITCFFGKEFINIGTILSTLFFGYFIDIGTFLLIPLNIPSLNLPLTLLALIIGIILSSVGVGYYIAQDIGTGAVDAIALILMKLPKLNFTYSRWILDSFLALSGILLGGAWGAATIAMLVFSGPIMNFVIEKVNKPKKVLPKGSVV